MTDRISLDESLETLAEAVHAIGHDPYCDARSYAEGMQAAVLLLGGLLDLSSVDLLHAQVTIGRAATKAHHRQRRAAGD